MAIIVCTVLATFTQFIPGRGMVHGNPDAEDAKTVQVPEEAVAGLVAEGKIEAPDGFTLPAATSAPSAPSPFTFKMTRPGRWEITGPGLATPEIVQGKKAVAEKRVAELEAALAKSQAGDGAPID
jgi:hypothetical protein